MKQLVFVTGCAGQIGSKTVDKLILEGYEVVGIDNFLTGKPAHLSDAHSFTFYEGDIRDSSLMEEIFSKHSPSAVVHAAASYDDPENWDRDIQVNLEASVNLVKLSQSHGTKKFVYFQTALVYGTEPKLSPIPLDHPKDYSNSSYAISKGSFEDYLAISGLPYVVFRLANVVGDRGISGPLPIFIKRLAEGQPCKVADTRRDFLYSEDLAELVNRAIGGTGHGPYHFSSGQDYSILELYREVERQLGIAPGEPELLESHEDDAASILLDPTKTYEDFGPVNVTPLSEIVKRAVDYYSEVGITDTHTHLKAAN